MAGSKKGQQSSHNITTGKYVKQKARTAHNKQKRIRRNEEIKRIKNGGRR